MSAYRLDLLYKWSSGRGLIVTPKGKLKWEENYAADREIAEDENYLLINLVYRIDEKGKVSNTGYSISTNFKSKEMMDELKKILKSCWIDYPETPDSLNYRIVALLSIFTGIKEWKFSEAS